MALTLKNFYGWETAGLEEIGTSAGSPDPTETTIVRTGTYSLKCPGAATKASVNIAWSIGTNQVGVLGFGVYLKDVTPTNDIILASGVGVFSLVLEATSGDLLLKDSADITVDTATAPFSVDIWYFVEVIIDNGTANTTSEVFVDNSPVISGAGDFNSILGFAKLQGSDTASEDVYFDDIYTLRDATDSSDRYGNFAVKGFQNTAEDATDQGDTLADGTWALVSETPGNSGTSNDASYVDTGNLTGSTIMDEGTRAGPSGDSDITGATIKGAKFISNLKRSAGGGREHKILYGNSGDGMTATADLLLTVDYDIYEVISELGSIVPTESESFQMGFSKSATAGQDILCGDQWAMLGYVPSVGAVPVINLVMAPYIPTGR